MNKDILSKLMTDPTALQLYTWLWLNQKDGKISFNCSSVAKELHQKRPTIYKALQKITKLLVGSSTGSSLVAQRTITVTLLEQSKDEVRKIVGSSLVAQPVAREENERKEKESNKERVNKAREYISSLRSETQGQLPGLKFPKKITISEPSKHPYHAIIAYCREKQGIEQQFAFYGKQTKASKEIFDCGYTEDDAKFVIDEMVKEDFWKAHPFDMMNVAKNMHTYMNRTVMYNIKPKGKYAFN